MAEYETRPLRVAVVGKGGREHALAWKIAQSPLLEKQFAIPGSDAISHHAHCIPVDLKRDNVELIADTALAHRIDLVVIGPEDPLSWGLTEACEDRGLHVFGPTQPTTRLESSKIWAYRFGLRYHLPFPESIPAENLDQALETVRNLNPGEWMIKADGLMAGKGVVPYQHPAQAERALKGWTKDGRRQVLFQRFTPGREFSAVALCDGLDFKLLPLAADHKAAFNGGKGPNTGGMGAYSPVPWAEHLRGEVEEQVIKPTLVGMASEHRPFRGFLYPGLVSTDQGVKLYEFNVRMGDPEAQVIMPRVRSDLLELMWAAVHHRLGAYNLKIDPQAWVCVVMASGGYPGIYRTDYPISGLSSTDRRAIIFHAGTKFDSLHGCYLTDGGRVLGVSAPGVNIAQAKNRAYQGVSQISFKDCHFRTDIAEGVFNPTDR